MVPNKDAQNLVEWDYDTYSNLTKPGTKMDLRLQTSKKRFMHIQIEIQNDLERFLAKSKYLYNILSYVGMSVRFTFSQRLQITWSDRRTPEIPDISLYAIRY